MKSSTGLNSTNKGKSGFFSRKEKERKQLEEAILDFKDTLTPALMDR